jgi:hypothetical protein
MTMGMSTHVIGFKAPDDRWQQMKAVWDACAAANVAIPQEVDDYFEGEAPDLAGVEVGETALMDVGALREWSDEYRQGYEVVLANVPNDVTTIRFYNSW